MTREPGRSTTSNARKTRKPRSTAPRVEPVIVPDTAERQVSAAVARINAAEAKRKGTGSQVALRRDGEVQRAPKTPAPTKADASVEFNLDAALDKLEPEFIECRDLRHPWRRVGTANWVPAERAWRQEIRCRRCGTIKIRIVGQWGALLSTSYIYPDGYQMPGAGRMTGSSLDAIRLKAITAPVNPED